MDDVDIDGLDDDEDDDLLLEATRQVELSIVQPKVSLLFIIHLFTEFESCIKI